MTTSNDFYRDRRLMIASGVGILFGIGGVAAFSVADRNPLPGSGHMMMGQVGGPPGVPGTTPGGPPAAGKPPTGGGTKTPPILHNSFDGAPVTYPGGAQGGAAASPLGGGGAAAPAGKTPPKPVVKGQTAAKYRPDPFVSYRFLPVDRTPPYTFLYAARFAKYPDVAQPPRSTGDPAIDFGPLPFVPRRVAGILYNGSTSAILETAGSDFRIVAPGVKVPSGIGGLSDLTVSAITPSQVTLRADDGRTVSVALSASATPLGGTGGGGFPGGGAPGGGGFPGGGAPGGGFGGGFGGGGGGKSGGGGD